MIVVQFKISNMSLMTLRCHNPLTINRLRILRVQSTNPSRHSYWAMMTRVYVARYIISFHYLFVHVMYTCTHMWTATPPHYVHLRAHEYTNWDKIYFNFKSIGAQKHSFKLCTWGWQARVKNFCSWTQHTHNELPKRMVRLYVTWIRPHPFGTMFQSLIDKFISINNNNVMLIYIVVHQSRTHKA